LILGYRLSPFWHENGVETTIKNQFFMRKVVLLSVILCVSILSQGQSKSANSSSYSTALGVKFYPAGITLKHFFNGNNAGEFIGYFWNRGFRLTGLYEIHGNISDVDGLKWYVGPGAHIGFYDYYNRNYHIDGTYFGIDGVLGLDYKFNGAPINISVDWQPSFEFGDYVGFTGNWGGLGIRYTF
jgi:hypothetical protein